MDNPTLNKKRKKILLAFYMTGLYIQNDSTTNNSVASTVQNFCQKVKALHMCNFQNIGTSKINHRLKETCRENI
jgi:hypothetical protein